MDDSDIPVCPIRSQNINSMNCNLKKVHDYYIENKEFPKPRSKLGQFIKRTEKLCYGHKITIDLIEKSKFNVIKMIYITKNKTVV